MNSLGKASTSMHCDVIHNPRFEMLLKIGFDWDVEQVEQGKVVRHDHKHNLYTVEGLNATLNILLGATAKLAGAYIGLFEGNYFPSINDVAATISAASLETNKFVGPTARKAWVASAPAAGGNINNYSNKAVFQFTAPATIYGGFLIASSAVGSTGGPLISILRFGSPYQAQVDTILNVGAGCTLSPA